MTSWYFDIIPNLIWIVPIAGAVISVGASKAGGAVRNAVAVITSLIAALLATSLFMLSDFTD